MSMKKTLNSILTGVEGALAAVIMAYDGIPIEEATLEQSDFDVQLLAVEYATVLKEIKRAIEVIKAGEMEEVCIATDQTRVIMRVLNNEMFTALIMRRNGNFGKGRYMLKMKANELLLELG